MAGETNTMSVESISGRAKAPRRGVRCHFCGGALPPAHWHCLESAQRRVMCACDICALRFQDGVNERFKRIPRNTRVLAGFRMTDAQWEELALPIDLAFFFHNSATGKAMVMSPSSAGAKESLLLAENWSRLVRENTQLTELKADVEALLVNRVDGVRDYFIAPIDVCYELVGLVHRHWHGGSGGESLWRELDSFFLRLRLQGQPGPEEAAHA
jgi:hypothetical protein